MQNLPVKTPNLTSPLICFTEIPQQQAFTWLKKVPSLSHLAHGLAMQVTKKTQKLRLSLVVNCQRLTAAKDCRLPFLFLSQAAANRSQKLYSALVRQLRG